MAIPPSDDTVFVPTSEFPGVHLLCTADNPVNLSDAPTEASNTGARPQGVDPGDESKILSHFSDTLDEMAQSIAGLEEGYFMALREVIHETEKALWDVSHIDSTYISCIITVMAGWQEAVQAATSHMESADTTIYLAHHEDAWRATKEYVAEVIKACEQHDADHTKEGELQKEAIKTGDSKDPVVRLLEAVCKAAHAQAERAMDIFLNKIKETLWKYVPISAQGSLIANALSTAFQFQMSIWWMIGDECIHPLQAKHSDWCGLAGTVQAIIETFPNNCTIMFLPAPVPEAPFSSTFNLDSS